MSRKDSAIKLFGRKIPLPESQIPANSSQIPSHSAPKDDCSGLKKQEVRGHCAENSEQLESSSDCRIESQHKIETNEAKVNSKPVEDKIDTSSEGEDRIMKKPDKIQQCPRCNSMDTKFCYFNNYNVNQPRHFCKNCQRYWTAGGTMRNVPVGAGRRRNKHLSSQYHHHRHIIVSSEGIPIPTTTKLESSDSSTCQNGTVLKFGPDAPLTESPDSILNLNRVSHSVDNVEKASSLCRSSVSNGVQCYPVAPWVVPVQWYHGVCPPSVPLQFVAPPFWNGTLWPSGSNGCLSSSSSSTLGKHSRDTVFSDEDKSAKCVLVPKKASTSPVWASIS